MNQRTPLTGGDGSLWFRMPEYSAYVNDSWNVTHKLAINWDYVTTSAFPHTAWTTTGA